LLMVRLVDAEFPALSVAVAVMVVEPSAEMVQGLDPQDRESEARPDCPSLPLPWTTTLERYQPLLPRVPEVTPKDTLGLVASYLNARLFLLDVSP